MYSIRAKILTITLVFLAFLGVAFVLYSITTTRNYKRLRLEGIEKTVALETEKGNKIIAGLERSAIYLVIDGLLFFQSQSIDIGETSALEFLRSFPTASGGGFWFEPYSFNRDMQRKGVYAYYDKASGEVRLDDIEDDYDYHSLSWYREIIDQIVKPYQVAWTKPYIDDTSFSLMTSAGAGIFDADNNLIGATIVDWEIERVVDDLTAIKPTENSFVLLCVPTKDYIISSTRTNAIVGASINSIPWDINADSFMLDGVRYLRFGRYMDNGWLLSIQIPENEIFAEMENQNSRFSFRIALLFVIVLCLAYFLISKLINAPIKRLISDVSHIALGNLNSSVNVTSNDELGLLAETFNKMTFDLKESIETNVRERAENEKMATELNVAAGIQSSMLPYIFPPFPYRTEFDIYASMDPAKEVGGDYYDFYLIDRDNLAVVIADVSGKGIPAALFMVISKTLMKNYINCNSPKDVFDIVNNKLCENNEANMFVTALMGFYTISTGRFIYVNAGHTPPLVRRAGNNFEFLRTKPCIVLGFMEDAEYKEEEIILNPGDSIYLYTDGVTEALNTNREFFSEQRLLEAMKKCRDFSPKELILTIKQEINSFAGGAEQADDITMLALGVNHYSLPDNLAKLTMEELTIEANVSKINDLIDFVNSELQRNNCPLELRREIDVATEEIFVNIADYAYEPASGMVTIGIFIGEEVLLRFEDSGKPFNPLERPVPDLDKPIMERETGGLGIFLIKQLMDKVYYSRFENKNILVIAKKINTH